MRRGNEVWEFDFVFLCLTFPIWNSAAWLEGSMLENNSKVAAGHPDRGYSIWLEFVCLAPSISVYLKFGSLNQPQERHLFLLTKVQWEGKGHSKVAGSAYPTQPRKAWCRALGITENTEQLWFLSLWSKAVLGNHQQLSLCRDCPFRGHCFTNPKDQGLLNGSNRIFFLVFRG